MQRRGAAAPTQILSTEALRPVMGVSPCRTVPLVDEADARTRTGDPFITSEVLYQLSYVGGVT
jgi:hypothetical protein